VPIVLKSGSLNLLEPLGPALACNGNALPLPLLVYSAELGNFIIMCNISHSLLFYSCLSQEFSNLSKYDDDDDAAAAADDNNNNNNNNNNNKTLHSTCLRCGQYVIFQTFRWYIDLETETISKSVHSH